MLITVAVWGINFVLIRIGLNGIPPLLLCAIRFLFCAIPAVFFIPRPKCSWPLLISFGLVLFAFQFSFLFCGMEAGMSPGLASLVMQFQAFFTIGLSAWLFRDKPNAWKIMGAVISFLGIVIVGLHTQGEITPLGLILTLLGSLSWAGGNILSKKIGPVNPLALVVWGSLVASPFLIIVTLALEGPAKISDSLQHISWASIGAIAYIVYLSTHLAYSLWSFLLNRYPAGTVAPFTLLVPVFGFVGSMMFLGEAIPGWKLLAAALVVLGLVFNIFGEKIYLRLFAR